MYIDIVPNRDSPPAVLLRESKRVGTKTVKTTVANLSMLPMNVVEGLRVLLKGGVAVESLNSIAQIKRSLPHGHVAVAVAVARQCGIPEALAKAGIAPRFLDLILALIVARLVDPASKLATHRMLHDETATTSLGKILKVDAYGKEDVYRALDSLAEAQPAIEKKLARKHLAGNTLVLYDLSSTWVTGEQCELAAYGYSRDRKRGEQQITFGLICTPDGCPLSVEVFAGNTSDSSTVPAQINKIKQQFGIERITWVGDRGMLTSKQIETCLKPSDMEWISSLRSSQIAPLVHALDATQMSLFDEKNLMEISSEDFPGERLVMCRNPFLADERAKNRESLLKATEEALDKIVKATQRARAPLHGIENIGVRVGKVIEQFKMAKHFDWEITETTFRFWRKEEHIKKEAALDGFYVIRTSLAAEVMTPEAVVDSYKNLAKVERAFRSIKTTSLNIRPLYHYATKRVKAHVFLCMLAYYIEWHMRKCLKPVLFTDEDIEETKVQHASPVTQAPRSARAKKKECTGMDEEGYPVHSFKTLLKDLATITHNTLAPKNAPDAEFVQITTPTPLQEKILKLLGVKINCAQ